MSNKRFLFGAFLLAIAAPGFAEDAARDRKKFQLEVVEERISLDAAAAPTKDVLAAIEKDANIEIAAPKEMVAGTLTVKVERARLEEGMRAVFRALQAENVSVIYPAADSTKKIRFVALDKAGNAPVPISPESAPSAATTAAESSTPTDERKAKKAERKRIQEEYTKRRLAEIAAEGRDPARAKARREAMNKKIEERRRARMEQKPAERLRGSVGRVLERQAADSAEGENAQH